MKIEITKDADDYVDVVIADEDRHPSLRMTVGSDGIERIFHERNSSAAELSLNIAAAIRALGATLEHVLSIGDRNG